MAVSLHRVGATNRMECVALGVTADQAGLVALNEKSLREADEDSNLFPLAVFDAAARGFVQPTEPMVGFVMYQLAAGVGFIQRLMIDARYQRHGYGRATLIEMVRRLKLHPEVELIATSHRRENVAMANLCRSVGFVRWEIAYNHPEGDETYLRWPETIGSA